MFTHKVTKNGHQELILELEVLKRERPNRLQDMMRMRELGDLSENAGYRASKRKLMQIDRRIAYLERFLSRAEVIQNDGSFQVSLGSRVVIVDGEGNHKTFVVVESHEADIMKQKISSQSPLGKSLLHRKRDDVVFVITQNGEKQYKIVEIS